MVNLQQRLARAEGQVRGVARMVADQRPCIEVLQQLASVQVALKGVTKSVLQIDHSFPFFSGNEAASVRNRTNQQSTIQIPLAVLSRKFYK